MIFQLSNNSSSKPKWSWFFFKYLNLNKKKFPRRINYCKTVNLDVFSYLLINSYLIWKKKLMMRAFYLLNWFSKYSNRSSIKPMVWCYVLTFHYIQLFKFKKSIKLLNAWMKLHFKLSTNKPLQTSLKKFSVSQSSDRIYKSRYVSISSSFLG